MGLDILKDLVEQRDKLDKEIEDHRKHLMGVFSKNQSDVIERFNFWVEHGNKVNYTMQFLPAKSGLDLFSAHTSPLCLDRHRTIEIDDIAETLFYRLEKIEKDGPERVSHEYPHSTNLTKEDILDWLEGLMKLELGSMIVDW